MRFLALAALLLASCQTTAQAKLVTVCAGSVALVGGAFEYETASTSGGFRENPPYSAIIGGVVAITSLASIYLIDDFASAHGRDSWRPDDYRAGSPLLAAIESTGYTLAVYRNGTVEYQGRAYVSVCGKAYARLAAEEVSELERQLLQARVTSMDPAYLDQGIMDAGYEFLWFRPSGGPTKAIAYYAGGLGAPEALVRAEEAIETAVHVEQWTGGHRTGSTNARCL